MNGAFCTLSYISVSRSVVKFHDPTKVKIVHHSLYDNYKVKCTLVQALRLCTGRTAHRGSRGIALLYRH
jgi:hypothetical protein